MERWTDFCEEKSGSNNFVAYFLPFHIIFFLHILLPFHITLTFFSTLDKQRICVNTQLKSSKNN